MIFDLPSFAQAHNISTLAEGHHHCHQGWVQMHCPLCTDGRQGYHLGWSEERGNLNCWRCGPVRVLDYIAAVTHVPLTEARRIHGRYRRGEEGEKIRPRTRAGAQAALPPGTGPLSPTHLRYLQQRGLEEPEEVARIWGLLGTRHLSGEWNWRVIAPVRDRESRMLAYVGRSVVPDAKPKYRLTETSSRGLLYGIERVPGDTVVVVEGPGDVWRLGPGAVATLGISWHIEQANVLRTFRRRLVMFDPDRKAQASARRLADWLSVYPGETEIIDGLDSDPGSLSLRDVKRLRRELGLGE